MTRLLGLAMLRLGMLLVVAAGVAQEAPAPPAGAGDAAESKELALDLGGGVTLKLVQIPAGNS